MSDVTVDNQARLTYKNDDGDELHIFRVPAGTVVHVTIDQGEDFQHTSAILIDDAAAPQVIKALQRFARLPVSIVEVEAS